MLADKGLAGLTINAVVAEAGMAKGSFYTHFPDRTAFIRELHRTFHEALIHVFLSATEDLEPGPGRLRAGVDAYLDACHDHPDAVVLLGEARFAEGVEEAIAERSTAMGHLVIEDLTATGWSDPGATAFLLSVAGSEVAVAEARAGRPRPDLRAALHDLAAGRTAPPRRRAPRTRTGSATR